MKKHPQQPVVLKNGIARFRANAIVEWAVDSGRIDLNEVAVLAARGQFSREDQIQFAQLMGYSVCGAADLSYMDDETIKIADQQADALLTQSYLRKLHGEDDGTA